AENKILVRRYVEEVLNKRNLTLIDELFAPTFIDHDSSMPQAKGPAGVKRLAAIVHTSFPDLPFTIEDIVAESHNVVYRYQDRGTHENDFMGIAATGKQISFTSIHIYRGCQRTTSGGMGKLGYAGSNAATRRAASI